MARDYFKIEDISTAKTGMFGYVTGIASHIAKDAAFHRNMLYKEFFLNTATMKNSIFNWARLLDYNIEFAKPASLQVALKLNTTKLMKLPSQSTFNTYTQDGTKLFEISRDQEFIVGTKKFMLPYTIELKVWYTGTTSVSAYARYKTGTEDANYRDPLITTEHLKVLVEGDTLTIFFNLYQFSKKSMTFDVMNNDILERSIYDINFGSNLVSFNTFYQTPDDRFANKDVWTEVPMYFGEVISSDSNFFGYYTMTGDSTLRVYFSPKVGDFNPAFNSRLRVSLMTTEGTEGNFSYSGSITAKDSWLDQASYNMISLTDPTGGQDQGNFKESKIALINRLRTRDSYITEKDLENLFDLIKSERIKKSIDTKVIKVRDDFFRRIYSVYLLLRLADGTVVPTNTVDLKLDFQEISERNFSIKAGTVVIYDRATSSYRLLSLGEIPDPYMYNTDAYVFVVPYLLNMDFQSFPKLNVYQTDYSYTVPVVYNPKKIQSGVIDAISLNHYSIQRNSLVHLDRFILSCDILGDKNALKNPKTGETRKIMAMLYDENVLIGMAPMTQVGETGQFYLDILTNDSFTDKGEYIIENTFYSPTDITSVIPEVHLVGKYRIDIAVYDPRNSDGSSITDYSLVTPVIEFNSSETIGIAEDISPYVHCPIHLNETTGEVVLKRVPLIGANFFFNEKYNRDIMATIAQLFKVVDETDVELENNTQLDLKYYNTSGVSRNYSIDTVDIKIHLQIKLRTVYSKELDKSIRDEIVKIVEASNYTMEKRFSISNLITALERKFTDIAFIQIYTVNNSNIQTISAIEGNEEKKLADYVPEFLTVKKLTGADEYGNDFLPSLTIDYL
jgi:hypothetical protein